MDYAVCFYYFIFPINNGSMYGFFKGEQGLRQGDPLSPLLFTLCLEYLSRLLKQLKGNSDFNFHPKCGAMKLTHLAFADDLILFSRGDVPSVKLIMECLKQFGDCSGLCINAGKSNLFAAGICRDELQEIKDITGFSLGKFPFRYLGIPVAASRLTIEQFNPLLSKVSDVISSWAGATLSYAGRCELIRAVLQGIECFWLSTLPFPAGVRNKVTKLCRNFLWSGKTYVSKKPLVAWTDLCKPKAEGGLGFFDLQAWNYALLSKYIWNIQRNRESLWIKWVNHIYLNGISFWELSPRKHDSQLIKQLCQIRDRIIEVEGSVEAAKNRINLWSDLGRFNARLSYEYFRPKGAVLHWPKLVWHQSLLPKHSFILWLGIKDRLLTKDKMAGYIDNTSCCLCGNDLETLDHLFFKCSFVLEVWTEIKTWLGLTRAMSTLKAAVKWSLKEAKGKGTKAVAKKVGLACVVYCIWETRNAKLFEDKATNPQGTIRHIKIQVYRILHMFFPDLKEL